VFSAHDRPSYEGDRSFLRIFFREGRPSGRKESFGTEEEEISFFLTGCVGCASTCRDKTPQICIPEEKGPSRSP